MDEVKQALDKVVSDGMKAIDALTPKQLAEVQTILEKVK